MKENQRKKGYKQMVNNYYDLVTRGYREIWGADYFHPHLWPKNMSRSESFNYTHNYILKKLNALCSSEVADYGCGIGAFSIMLSKNFKTVTAINFNKKQLLIADRNIKSKRIKNIKLVEQDLMKSTYKDKFDVVFLYDVAPHLPDKEKALKIIWKALKPGGKLVMTEWLIPKNISKVAKMLLVEPFNITWAFPFLETDENYKKYFKRNNYKLLISENWTKGVGKSINFGYNNFISTVNSFSLKKVANILDISMFKNIFKISEKVREVSEMVLYSKALYDSNNFLYYFYIVEKPLQKR